MPIRILPKYNSGNPEPEPNNEPVGNVFSKLTAKLKFQRENIEPLLGDLFPLYRDECILFHAGKYLGRNNAYGYSRDRGEDYDRIGRILAKS